MSLIVCPECQNEMNQYAEVCPKCGFPIQKFMNKNGLNDFTHIKICPKCGSINSSSMPDIIPTRFKCQHCGTQVVQTDIPCEGFRKRYTLENEREYTASIANKYGGNQFSYEMYDKWVNKMHEDLKKQHQQQSNQSNIPMCPTCGSTNIEKISAGKKIGGGFLFGIFSSDVRNTMHCKDCGAKW